MEIIGKYLLMFLITLLFKWIFATCFHFAAKNICENYSEPDSNQVYIFLKYLSWFLIVLLFIITFVWDKIGFVYLTTGHRWGMALFSFFLLYYFRSSMKLISHLINLLYFPQLVGDRIIESAFGDVKKIDERYYFIHDSSKIKIDITNRIR